MLYQNCLEIVYRKTLSRSVGPVDYAKAKQILVKIILKKIVLFMISLTYSYKLRNKQQFQKMIEKT